MQWFVFDFSFDTSFGGLEDNTDCQKILSSAPALADILDTEVCCFAKGESKAFILKKKAIKHISDFFTKNKGLQVGLRALALHLPWLGVGICHFVIDLRC